MRSRNLIAILCLLLGLLAPLAHAGVYRLNDGRTLSGEPISFNESGLIVRLADGGVSPRTDWSEFTQDALKRLLAEAKTDKDKAFVSPYIEEIVQQEAKSKEIVIKEPPKPELPTGKTGLASGFSSPVFLVIFLILYAANIYAAYEIALFKYQLPMLVCGVAAIAPGLGPILFLCLPSRPDPNRDTTTDAPQPVHEELLSEDQLVEVQTDGTEPLAAGHTETATAPKLPAPVVFHRGDFSFNRRFFETKLAGFLRVIPGEAEKDMVVVVKSLRGNFVGKRVISVTQSELNLQVAKDNVTHDEMIPFTEIQEVRIQHKDLPQT